MLPLAGEGSILPHTHVGSSEQQRAMLCPSRGYQDKEDVRGLMGFIHRSQ